MISTFFSSMTSRIFVILVGGILVTASLVMLLAQNERNDFGNQIRTRHAIERAQEAILSLEAVPASSRESLASIQENSGVRIDFINTTSNHEKNLPSQFSLALQNIYGADRAMQSYSRQGTDCPIRHKEVTLSAGERRCESIYTSLKDGTPIRIDVALSNGPPPPPKGSFIFNNILFILGILLISLLASHISTKPLRQLSLAAQHFGNNIQHPPLSVKKGPKEVREAAIAFNTMQTSIRNHIQERTYMLAAIAHDLQTPLTRLRLRLEKVSDDDLRKSLIGDLTDTQNMIREGLEYAQLMNTEEPLEQVDLDSMIAAICDDAMDAGSKVQLEGAINKPIMASPHALRRCITNLLDNAIKYGGFAHIHVKQEANKAVITITDAGPGIPEDQLETVFQPFKRLEDSRSRASGGTGLGLTIARIIAGRHHGTIKLSNLNKKSNTINEDSGLIATLELPIK